MLSILQSLHVLCKAVSDTCCVKMARKCICSCKVENNIAENTLKQCPLENARNSAILTFCVELELI